MSISTQSGARGLKRLIWLRYDIVLKGQNTFNLGLNAAKNSHYKEKASNKSSQARVTISPGVELGGLKD